MKRYIYAFDTPEAAHSAVQTLRERGVSEKCISLAARSDIQLEKIPDRYLDVKHDFMPALGRGAALGGVTGLFAGLVAMAIPPLGIVLGGAELLSFLAGGAVLGAWLSSMVGASVPDEVHRKFEDEIKAGRTLLVVDSDGRNDTLVAAAMAGNANHHLLWQSNVGTPAAV
ncbi:MAG TPA: hypothetical protein VFB32_13985 [Rudaea sp.]|nr:hypothetical protein [Rudaea sp.]